MRRISKPELEILKTFDSCLSGISDDSLKSRLDAVRDDILLNGKEYDLYAKNNQLHLMLVCNKENDDIVVGAVKKSELKKVYTQYMVGTSKPARKFYDFLRESAPKGICPYCGFTPVGTLDHYLPKTKYPKLSVLPYNLVPSCGLCNTDKLAQTANSPDQQTIHPYYDDDRFVSERWLFAEVIESSPPSVRFFVDPPSAWTEVDKNRVRAHFHCYDLAKRFAVVSSTTLSATAGLLALYFQNKDARQKHLHETAQSFLKVHANSWEGAVFDALSNSSWYCEIGYKLNW